MFFLSGTDGWSTRDCEQPARGAVTSAPPPGSRPGRARGSQLGIPWRFASRLFCVWPDAPWVSHPSKCRGEFGDSPSC